MAVPWPPMNFVAEWTTMSAPHSSGRTRYGVAKVLSTTSGMPALWATAATASMSIRLLLGLPSVSMNMALVLSVMAASKLPSISGSTKVVVMPLVSGSVWASRL